MGSRYCAIEAQRVQHIGDAAGQIFEGEELVYEFLGYPRKFDLFDTFRRHATPDASLSFVFLVVLDDLVTHSLILLATHAISRAFKPCGLTTIQLLDHQRSQQSFQYTPLPACELMRCGLLEGLSR